MRQIPSAKSRKRRTQIQRAVGERIRSLRMARDWTAGELAARAGMSKQDISKLELGASGTTLDRYSAVAAALNVPLPSLFSRSSAA